MVVTVSDCTPERPGNGQLTTAGAGRASRGMLACGGGLPAHAREGEGADPGMTGDKATRFGHPTAEWERAKEQATAVLRTCARERATITYGQLCDAVDAVHLRPYSFAIVAFLDEICAEDDAAHGIVLASLVVRRDTGMPGEGYFRYASSVGADVSDRREFWEMEAERVYSAFAEGSTTG
jgi:hypothetical protein